MTVKEKAIKLIETLPEEATFEGILRALWEEQATEEALRRFDARGGIPDDDVTDEEWMQMIARSWADSLNDPRDDVYSID
ncbi:MAG TPA: hypothetical protein VGZ25_04520 [Gemmataceae bacterium]|jgi:hypothetical protein|nr:hypothetical protein [Gemmataceae bacterium]